MSFETHTVEVSKEFEEFNRMSKERGGENTMEQGNVERFDAICARMTELYEKKNVAYGDSFHLSFLDEGLAMPRIRLGDKMNRFKIISRACDYLSDDGETMIDTLMDMANYAVMTIMELEEQRDLERDSKHV